MIAKGYALFPELIADGTELKDKYDGFALWLVADFGVVNNHLRDGFSAGGQVELPTLEGETVRMPATFGRINRYQALIRQTIERTPEAVLKEYWKQPINKHRIKQWCVLAAIRASTSVEYHTALSVLRCIFNQ